MVPGLKIQFRETETETERPRQEGKAPITQVNDGGLWVDIRLMTVRCEESVSFGKELEANSLSGCSEEGVERAWGVWFGLSHWKGGAAAERLG